METPRTFRGHLRAGLGAGRLAEATHTATAEDPACGDRLTLDLEVREGRVARLRWRASGCSATLAAASALASLAPGRAADAEAVSQADLLEVLQGLSPARRHALRLVTRTFALAITGAAREDSTSP